MNSHPAANLFPLLQGTELQALAEDIREHGQQVPIVTHQGMILDGRNRFAACELVGAEPRFEDWNGTGSPIEWVLSINLHRRHLNESQRAMVAARAKPMFEGEARERQLASRAKPGERADRRNVVPNSEPRSGEKAAGLVNVGRNSVNHASAVLKRATPELVHAVDSGRIAVSAAAGILDRSKKDQAEIVRRVESGEAKTITEALRQTKRDDLAKLGTALPSGKYRVVYADPPWQYNDARNVAGKETTAAADHYPTMSVEDLCALDVKSIAEPDAVLFCWATFPLLPDALTVVKAWGFTYKTAFVWEKNRTNFGHYHDASAELLLVCTRGSCTPDADEREEQVQGVPHPGKHSTKPEAFRELIERLYVHGEKIELFRRGNAPKGWAVYGNEAT